MTMTQEPVNLIILRKCLSSYSCVRKINLLWDWFSVYLALNVKFQWQPLQTEETCTINVKAWLESCKKGYLNVFKLFCVYFVIERIVLGDFDSVFSQIGVFRKDKLVKLKICNYTTNTSFPSTLKALSSRFEKSTIWLCLFKNNILKILQS